jgi:hypothetical protein
MTEPSEQQPDNPLPTELGQYLFEVSAGVFTLWALTPSGWYDSAGVFARDPGEKRPFFGWYSVRELVRDWQNA